jgi:hypothetical protein
VAVSAASVAAASAAAAAALGVDATTLVATDNDDNDTMVREEVPKVAAAAEQLNSARANDSASGPGAKLNSPGEAISEPPVTVGEKQAQRSSSRFIGVCWYKAQSSWCMQQYDPQLYDAYDPVPTPVAPHACQQDVSVRVGHVLGEVPQVLKAVPFRIAARAH